MTEAVTEEELVELERLLEDHLQARSQRTPGSYSIREADAYLAWKAAAIKAAPALISTIRRQREALHEARGALKRTLADNDGAFLPRSCEGQCRSALSTIDAALGEKEEDQGSDGVRRSGRGTEASPPDGPVNTGGRSPCFTVVFAGDVRDLPFNPLRMESPFGMPIACGAGDAFAEIDALSAPPAETACEVLKELAQGLAQIVEASRAPPDRHGRALYAISKRADELHRRAVIAAAPSPPANGALGRQDGQQGEGK